MTQYVQERVEKMESPITAWILLSLVITLSCVYAYFINGTIQNIVEAKDMRTKISTLTSSVSGLETDYIAQKSSLDLAYAHEVGFSDGSQSTVYIAKKSEPSLSFNR